MTDDTACRLVLASASPRRHELLSRLGVPFEVRPADVDEAPRPDEAAADLVARLAIDKAQAVAATWGDGSVVVLGADTVVVLDGRILGKPTDPADAVAMLQQLSGRTHVVLTGLAVVRRDGPPASDATAATGAALGPAVQLHTEVASTDVRFASLSADEIEWYVASGEPLDKAGAYGIQGLGGAFVLAIDGSYDNVVGLPLAVTRRLLADVGIETLGGQPPLV